MAHPEAESSHSRLLDHLLIHGGETGSRIRQIDWATTPIGPFETWPQSLQIALQILLSSRFPMQLLWGPDYIQFYNDAYIPIAGEKHPTGLGQRAADCWNEVWDFAGPLLDYVMNTGQATWSVDQLLMLNRNGYPEECYFTFSYSPIWQATGSVGGIFIAIQETTQKILSERRERELRVETETARKAAEQANRLKDQFLAVLSHELRSPLNPILGWATLLRSRKLDNATMSRALETIERNAKLQTHMIDDLLDISRILKNKLQLNLAPIHLISVVENALETVQTQAQAKFITIEKHLDEAPVQVMGDANRLQQVVWNLLSNAIKFTPDGGSVTIQLSYSDEVAVIQVRDTGRGIKADFLPYVFEHFRQADSKTTKVFGGLGLGLAIAKQIVDKHGGTIQVESPGENQGATFTVHLPLTNAPSQPIKKSETVAREEVLQNIHVLVVEDDDDNREILQQTLRMNGARVTAVDSAEAAMDVLAADSFDVVLSDIGMPSVDGFMLIQHIRQSAPTQHIPAIALTAYVSEDDQNRAIAAGFQDHLSKPLEPTKLVKAILNTLKA